MKESRLQDTCPIFTASATSCFSPYFPGGNSLCACNVVYFIFLIARPFSSPSDGVRGGGEEAALCFVIPM